MGLLPCIEGLRSVTYLKKYESIILLGNKPFCGKSIRYIFYYHFKTQDIFATYSELTIENDKYIMFDHVFYVYRVIHFYD